MAPRRHPAAVTSQTASGRAYTVRHGSQRPRSIGEKMPKTPAFLGESPAGHTNRQEKPGRIQTAAGQLLTGPADRTWRVTAATGGVSKARLTHAGHAFPTCVRFSDERNKTRCRGCDSSARHETWRASHTAAKVKTQPRAVRRVNNARLGLEGADADSDVMKPPPPTQPTRN